MQEGAGSHAGRGGGIWAPPVWLSNNLFCRVLARYAVGVAGASGRPGEREEHMPEAATTEFWKDIKPIGDVFKPDGLPEIFCRDAPTDDLRYYVPLTETVFTRPLFISPSQNRWCDILMATGPGLVNRHCRGLPLRGAGRGAHSGGL